MNGKRIGEKLVALRGERTQAEVATAVGISTSALAMYETGHRIPRDEIKLKLAVFYSTTVQVLFFED
ncbi:MAG: helix-turn-helix transcriptional regulator [Clostridia bacterium]|nr:helix-turn-helix transcriptional regulator [Clostridia bacterium]